LLFPLEHPVKSSEEITNREASTRMERMGLGKRYWKFIFRHWQTPGILMKFQNNKKAALWAAF
jgi:hypothetical protein